MERTKIEWEDDKIICLNTKRMRGGMLTSRNSSMHNISYKIHQCFKLKGTKCILMYSFLKY